MWTSDNRPKYNCDKLRYPSDLTDAEWSHIGPLPLRQGLDLRVLFLQPLLDQGFVALQGAMQRFLAGDAELGQKPPHRDKPVSKAS